MRIPAKAGSKLLGVLLALSALSCLVGADQVAIGSASVYCVSGIAVSEATPMDWGVVVLPAGGTSDFALDWESGGVVLSGTTSKGNPGRPAGGSRNGLWVVTGTPGAEFSFSISISTFSGAGVSLRAAHINGGSNSGWARLDATGNRLLKTGGVIRVDSAACAGAHTATATVVVNYL